jgi:cation diffusion facilitator family transporter
LTTTYSDKNVFRIQLFAVVAGILLLAAKFVAFFYTHSNTILTDALESIMNVLAGFFALYSLYLSSKPKDFDHPYGHGKVEFISAGFEGLLIIIAGISIIIKSSFDFFSPAHLEHLDVGMVIIVISGLVNFGLGVLLVRVGKSNNSMTLTADGQHLKSDAYTSFGIVVGLVLIILTGLNVLDNIVAMVFGLLIIYMGVRLTRKSIAGIMDEADETVIQSIVENIAGKRKPEWIDVHNLRVIQYGNKLHVDCHVTMPWYFTLEASHKEIDEISALINQQHGQGVEFFIHGDPCVPKSCPICMVKDCNVRQFPFKGKVEWNSDMVRRNHKHGEELI